MSPTVRSGNAGGSRGIACAAVTCLVLSGYMLAGTAAFAVQSEEQSMVVSRFKFAKDLMDIADGRSGLPDDSGGMSFPVPQKLGGELSVAIFFFGTSAAGGKFRIYPPHHLMQLDPRSGEVRHFEARTPDQFGVNDAPGQPIAVSEIRPGTGGEYQLKRTRFLEISPSVWELYSAGSKKIAAHEVALVREYIALFNDVAKASLIPYYKAVAADFFTWLDGAAK